MAKQQEDRTPRDWFRAEGPRAMAGGGTSADIYIYDAIGGWFGIEAADFVQALTALNVDQINLYVNSPGGDVFDATAMANALRRHPANVVATVDGLAASAASFLITAADEVVMGQGSTLMIHDAWSVAIGNAQDMRDTADVLDKLSDNIAGMYAAKAGGTAEDWRLVMTEEQWFSADEAVEAGLADRVAGDVAAAENRFDLSVFAHAGRADAPEPPLDFIRSAGMRAAAFVEDHISPAGEVSTQEEPAPNQKEDAVTDKATAPEAPTVELHNEMPAAMSAQEISAAVREGFQEILASASAAKSPGVPSSFAKTGPKEPSFAEAMNLFAARQHGTLAPEQRERVESTLTNGAEVFNALTNVSLGDATSGGLVHTTPPQWIGELITKVPYSGLWDAISHDDLTSPNVQAFVMQTEPTGGDKADGGAAVVSTGVKWVLDTFNALRWAGADSFDRTPFDFGIQASALSSYFRVQLRNYYIWRDTKLVTALTTGISPVAAAAAPAGSAITEVVNQILDGVVNVLNQGGGVANLAAVPVASFKNLIKNSREQAPAFVTLDLGALTQGDVEGKIQVRPELTGTLTNGDVLVANGAGITGYELPSSPVRAEQVQVSIGNIDVGLFGYALALLDSPNYVSLVSQGS